MAVLLTVARAVRGPLTVNLPSTAVPNGADRLQLTVNRFAWPAGDGVATASLEYSMDGGSTWLPGTNITMAGGQVSYKGNPDAPSGFSFGPPPGTGRLVRGTAVLAVALDLSVTVESLP